MKRLLLLCVLLTLVLLGCGSDSLTGNLTLTDITKTAMDGGVYKIEATAKYTPADSGKDATGIKISFLFEKFLSTGKVTYSETKYVNKAGEAPTFVYVTPQGTEPYIIRLTASYGDLVQTKIDTIPALATN